MAKDLQKDLQALFAEEVLSAQEALNAVEIVEIIGTDSAEGCGKEQI